MDRFEGIRAFVAVVDAGSFTAAGERLRISNKLVSKYVAALECLQGVTLLNRTTRSLSLTLAGERYLVAARRVLDAVAELDAQSHADEGTLTGRLRITAPVSFGEMFIDILTRDFLAIHPTLDIDLRLSDRFDDLAAQGFDLAIRIGALSDSSLIARRIGRTEIWTVAAPAYLADRPAPAHPDRLKDHICLRDGNLGQPHRGTFVIQGKAVSVPLPGRITVNSAQAIRSLVLAGEGVALSPRFVVARDVAEGRLVRLLADFPGQQLDIQALYLPQPFMPPRLTAYLDHLRARLRPVIEGPVIEDPVIEGRAIKEEPPPGS